VTHAENRIQVFYAASACDANATESCCRLGQAWNGTRCIECLSGFYGVWSAAGAATCASCPTGCIISGLAYVPATCSGITGCADTATDVARCDCGPNQYKDNTTDTCVSCPMGQQKRSATTRPTSSLDAPTLWSGMLNTCEVVVDDSAPLACTTRGNTLVITAGGQSACEPCPADTYEVNGVCRACVSLFARTRLTDPFLVV
jgi:hypothetical protein